MTTLEALSDIILKEAPLSSYIKKAVSPSAYIRGAGKVLQGASKAAGGFTTSTKSLASTLGSAANVATKVGGMAPAAAPDSKKRSSTIQTQKLSTVQEMPSDLSKTKTEFNINGKLIPAKYIGNLKNGFPVFQIKGVSWARSVVIEPQGKNNVRSYLYTDKKPNIKKPPAVVRPGTFNFSGIENKLVIVTK